MAEADEPISKPAGRRPRRKAPPSPATADDSALDTPDPIEIAMKAVAVGAVPGSAARMVLEKHAGLIDIQCRREQEELGVLRVQRITRWLILLAVAALLLATVAIIWNASRSVSLVVEPFRVPPALGNAGLGGEVMATRVMDQIALMQSRTLSTRPAESYSTDWGDDINVAIPNTGTTVGDLRRLLRSWFGRETRISGEVLRLGESWTVTARVSGHNAVSATGPDLEPLVTQVAEGVFRQTQPYRHVIYLVGGGRRDEALAAARTLALSGPEAERPWGQVAYANAFDGSTVGERERLPAVRRAAEALPDFPMPVGNYSQTLQRLGRWEEALVSARRAARLVGDGSAISDEFRGQYLHSQPAYVAGLTGNHLAAATGLDAASMVGNATYAAGLASDAAFQRYLVHDVSGGDRSMVRYRELTGQSRGTNQVAALGLENLDEAQRYELLAQIAVQIARSQAIGDRAALARDLPVHVQRLRTVIAGFPAAPAQDLARILWPQIAPDLARIGRAAEAEALLAPLEGDCYPCLVARGEVAAARLDRAAARRWFAEAARQGPSLPFVAEALGRMLMSAGDLDGAFAAFAEANRIEPRWAEPLMHLGDLSARRNAWREAERYYREAADRAPRWGALQLAWARALWHLDRHDQARATLRAAAAMDLSGADRARLRRMIAFAG